jgi:hypothetical protein
LHILPLPRKLLAPGSQRAKAGLLVSGRQKFAI